MCGELCTASLIETDSSNKPKVYESLKHLLTESPKLMGNISLNFLDDLLPGQKP